MWEASRGRRLGQMRHLLAAGQAAAAHGVFLRHVAPALWLDNPLNPGHETELRAALGELVAQRDRVSDWDIGGEVYRLYFTMVDAPAGGWGGAGAGAGFLLVMCSIMLVVIFYSFDTC